MGSRRTFSLPQSPSEAACLWRNTLHRTNRLCNFSRNHGTTFGGNPLACALGCELLSIVSEPAFLEKVTRSGETIRAKLWALAKEFPVIRDVRGNGLLIGVEMAVDPKAIIPLCKEKGLLLIKAEHNTVRFMPPLIVEQADIDAALAIFEDVMKIIAKEQHK